MARAADVATLDPPSTRVRWRLPAAVAGLALIAAAGWGAWTVLSDGDRSSGPLRGSEDSSLAWPQPAGVPFGFGVPVLVNPGSETAVLERVSLVEPSAGLVIRRAYVGGPERKFMWFGTSLRWPDPERNFTDLHPVRGYRLAPQDQPGGDRGAELVLVLEADEPGRYGFDAIDVDYRIGETEHRVRVHNRLQVCVGTGEAARKQECELPEP